MTGLGAHRPKFSRKRTTRAGGWNAQQYRASRIQARESRVSPLVDRPPPVPRHIMSSDIEQQAAKEQESKHAMATTRDYSTMAAARRRGKGSCVSGPPASPCVASHRLASHRAVSASRPPPTPSDSRAGSHRPCHSFLHPVVPSGSGDSALLRYSSRQRGHASLPRLSLSATGLAATGA